MPRFSVIIPTRERHRYIRQSLLSCTSQSYDDVEIIVSDNFSCDETEEIVCESMKKDSRIRYINPGRRLGMSEHWEFALRETTGDYVMIIGDDDALAPDAFEYCEKLLQTWGEVDTIHSSFQIYMYPETNGDTLSNYAYLQFSPRTHLADPKIIRDSYLSGQLKYNHLPGVYYGFYSRDMVQFILESGIRGIAPDVFCATAAITRAQRILISERPLAIAGVSKVSNGGLSLRGDCPKKGTGLLTKESKIQTHPLLEALSFPIDSAIPLLQIDSILKIGFSQTGFREASMDWNAHFTNAYNELKGRVGEEVTKLKIELNIALEKVSNTTMPTSDFNATSVYSHLSGDGFGWKKPMPAAVTCCNDANPEIMSSLILVTEAIQKRNQRYLKNLPNLFFVSHPWILAFETMDFLRNNGRYALSSISMADNLPSTRPDCTTECCNQDPTRQILLAYSLLYCLQFFNEGEKDKIMISSRILPMIGSNPKIDSRYEEIIGSMKSLSPLLLKVAKIIMAIRKRLFKLKLGLPLRN